MKVPEIAKCPKCGEMFVSVGVREPCLWSGGPTQTPLKWREVPVLVVPVMAIVPIGGEFQVQSAYLEHSCGEE